MVVDFDKNEVTRKEIQVGAEFKWENGPKLFKIAPELFDTSKSKLAIVDGKLAGRNLSKYMMCFQAGEASPQGATKVKVLRLPDEFHKSNTLKLQPPVGAIIDRDNVCFVIKSYPLFFIELFFMYHDDYPEGDFPLIDNDGDPVKWTNSFPLYLPWTVTRALDGFTEDYAKIAYPPLRLEDGTYYLNGKQVIIVDCGRVTYK